MELRSRHFREETSSGAAGQQSRVAMLEERNRLLESQVPSRCMLPFGNVTGLSDFCFGEPVVIYGTSQELCKR